MENLAEEKYPALFGVRKATFDAMLAVLERAYEEMRKKGGRKRKLSVLDILIILFGYHHDDRSMESFAFEYGVHKQRISEAIAWAERTLYESDSFIVPSKRKPEDKDTEISRLIEKTMSKQEVFGLIKEHPLFDNIDSDNLEKLLKCLAARDATYKKGDIYLNIGDKMDNVYVLLKGRIRAITEDMEGHESVYWELPSPATLGDGYIFAGHDYSGLKYQAATDCEMLLISSAKLKTFCQHKCDDHVQVIMNTLHSVSKKIVIASYKVDILSKPTVRRKILCFLDYQSGGMKKFAIPYNRNEMAQFLCVDRASLSKELIKLQDEGLIRFNRNEFELLL